MRGKSFFLGIFIIILISFAVLCFAEKPSDIKLSGFVNDYAEIFTPEQKTNLSFELETIFNSGQAEVAVVTINSLGGLPVEDFAYQVANGKLGSTETNNGMLILVSVEDRKYRFEVGRGLEPIFNDAKVGRIGRTYIVPNFQKGDYYAGIYSSVLSIKSILLNETGSQYYVKDVKTVDARWIILGFWIFIFIIIIISAIVQKKGLKGNKRNDNDFFFAALAASSILRGGKGGGGLGGGGFGGFGGGGFSGGGAGGGW